MIHRDPGTLTALNQRLHQGMDDALVGVLSALTELDLPKAAERWRDSLAALDQHAEVEERLAIPPYAELPEPPRGGSAELMGADHVILKKAQAAASEALGGLREVEGELRLAVIEVLPLVYRVRSVLEHHTAREQDHLYPALDRALGPEAAEALAAALSSS